MTTVQQETLDVPMPQMGVSVTEGTIIEWKVEVGDVVELDQTICEISTDKVETEVPSPVAGKVVELVIPVEETVPVGTVIARIATGAPAADAVPPHTGASPAGDASAAVPRRGYTPVVRRMAEVHGLDLEQIDGTGRGGRVTKRDVQAYLDGQNASGVAPEPVAAQAPAPPPAPPAPAPGTTEPLSRMRRQIAEHMTRSVATSAHVHTFIETDMSRVEAARAQLGVTALPIVARAAIDTLRAHPYLNASLDGDKRTIHSSVNLGVAVALPDGLIVPVIHNAQDLSVEGLAARIRGLAARARAGQLTPDDVTGGTFTITNPGRRGTLLSTPIISQPQVAILTLEGIVKRPVVVDDAIAIRPTTVLGLGWDHRAVDGAIAADFLGDLRDSLEAWA